MTVFFTILFWVTTLDVDLQALAYSPVEPHWPYAQRQPWKLLHDFGTLPGLLLSLAATAALSGSFLHVRLLRWRSPALYILALLALGPGIITNIFGKILTGRPRPDEVIPFGGTMEFLRPFELGTPGGGFSFLCGHCSMGFLFFAGFFLFTHWMRWVVLALATLFGMLLGIARMAAAAHFPSDVLIGGALMFTLAGVLAPIARIQSRPAVSPRRRLAIVSGVVVFVAVTVAFLFSTPIHKSRTRLWIEGTSRKPATNEMFYRWDNPESIRIEVDRGDITVNFVDQREPLVIRSVVRGYGWPGADGYAAVAQRNRLLKYEHRLERGHWEIHARFDVRVRSDIDPRRVEVLTHRGKVSVNKSGP